MIVCYAVSFTTLEIFTISQPVIDAEMCANRNMLANSWYDYYRRLNSLACIDRFNPLG